MSELENEEIANLSGTVSSLTLVIKWLSGIVALAACGGFVVASWISGVDNRVTLLREKDAEVRTIAAELRGEQKAHATFIGQLQQGSAVMNRDVAYIKEAVDDIKNKIKGEANSK
jgi:hypothetical protein